MAVPRDDLAALLANAGWVRALGVELVGRGEADDLVQDAWLVALARPAGVLNPAAWLSGVVRRLAGRSRRSADRRARREERAARGEREPAADELVAEAEVQRALIAEVTRLEEPYRSTVLLHYYRGWSLAEIARSQGIPDATARTRLRRALARLRERLDRAHGGREAWALVFVPSAAPAAAGTISGGALVGMKAKLAAGAALAALGGYVVWKGIEATEGDSARAAALAAGAEEAGSAGASAAPAGPAVEAESASRVPLEASPAARFDEVLLYGSVLDTTGEKVELEALALADDSGTTRSVSRPSAGSYSLAGLRPGTYTLSARAVGFLSIREPFVVRADDEHQRYDLHFGPALSIPVAIVDEEGNSLGRWRHEQSGVSVELVVTRSPPSGSFHGLEGSLARALGCGVYQSTAQGGIPGLPEGCSGILRLQVPLPVHVNLVLFDALLETRLIEQPVSELVFEIDRGLLEARFGGVRARLVDALGGEPLREGTVGLDPPNFRGFGQVPPGEDGVVLMTGRPPGLYHLRYHGPGRADLDRRLRIPEGRTVDLGDVPVWPAATIRGTVVDARGRTLQARVHCVPRAMLRTPGDLGAGLGQSTFGGRFELERTARGPVQLMIVARDHSWLTRTVDASSGLVDGLELRLEQGVPVVFRASEGEMGRQLTLADESGIPFATWTLSSGSIATRLAPGRYQVWTGVAERVDEVEELVVGEEPVSWSVGGR